MRIFWAQPPSRIGISERPRGGDWLSDEVRAWKAAGVDVVVSLLAPEEVRELDLREEEAVCRGHGIEFRSFPIPDRDLPASTAAAIELAAVAAGAVRDGKSVVVHCRQGIGRSAIIVAAVLVQLGWDPEDALRAIEAARGRRVPDTDEQRAWILDLPRRRGGER